MDLEIFEFLGQEVPNSIEDIRESLDLVNVSLENAIEQIGKKVEENFAEKNYRKASELSLNSEKVEEVKKEIQNIINKLDNVIDKSDIVIDNTNVAEKEVLDYSKYLVDSNIEHTLYEDYTHKRPVAISIEGNNIEVSDWKNALVETMNYLANKDQNIIKNFVDDDIMNGKKVKYFANNKKDIARSPKKIENVDIFVETNQSANSIRNLIMKALKKYNINNNKYKIFLKADYSELH